MYAVVVQTPGGETVYRLPESKDFQAWDGAAQELESSGLLDIEPDIPLPPDGALGFRLQKYGVTHWREIFNVRQRLVLLTYSKLLRSLDREPGWPGDANHSALLKTVLGLTISKMASFTSSLAVWRNVRTCVAQTFGRQTLSMVWDFGEMNPFASSAGDFSEALEYLKLFVRHVQDSISGVGNAVEGDARRIGLPDDSAQLFFSDPPYYDAVPYGHLSEFFLYWLSAAGVIESSPEQIAARRQAECIVDAGLGLDRLHFETGMRDALQDARRVAAPDALGVVVFAHKSTEGWETQLQAMLDAGWVVTGSWPIDTERSGRLRAYDSAALASSVHIVCRPRENPDGSVRTDDIGDWRSVLEELPQRIRNWLPRLANEGIVGADAIFACLGPALEIFSRYSRVEKASGEGVKLGEYLEHVWAAVSREALSTIFDDADATGFDQDARLTAMWLWTINAGSGRTGPGTGDAEGKAAAASLILEYDTVRKIAQGLGAHLEKMPHVIEIKGDKARLLPVGERTEHLFGTEEKSAARRKSTSRGKRRAPELFPHLGEDAQAEEWGDLGSPDGAKTDLDKVHQAMLLFGAGRADGLKRLLVDEGVGSDAQFWKLGQALSALYPVDTEEKRWVDGVLARKKGLGF